MSKSLKKKILNQVKRRVSGKVSRQVSFDVRWEVNDFLDLWRTPLASRRRIRPTPLATSPLILPDLIYQILDKAGKKFE